MRHALYLFLMSARWWNPSHSPRSIHSLDEITIEVRFREREGEIALTVKFISILTNQWLSGTGSDALECQLTFLEGRCKVDHPLLVSEWNTSHLPSSFGLLVLWASSPGVLVSFGGEGFEGMEREGERQTDRQTDRQEIIKGGEGRETLALRKSVGMKERLGSWERQGI